MLKKKHCASLKKKKNALPEEFLDPIACKSEHDSLVILIFFSFFEPMVSNKKNYYTKTQCICNIDSLHISKLIFSRKNVFF